MFGSYKTYKMKKSISLLLLICVTSFFTSAQKSSAVQSMIQDTFFGVSLGDSMEVAKQKLHKGDIEFSSYNNNDDGNIYLNDVEFCKEKCDVIMTFDNKVFTEIRIIISFSEILELGETDVQSGYKWLESLRASLSYKYGSAEYLADNSYETYQRFKWYTYHVKGDLNYCILRIGEIFDSAKPKFPQLSSNCISLNITLDYFLKEDTCLFDEV